MWNIIFTHYQVSPSQDSNLDFVSLALDTANGESYLTFYERLCHHQRTHLASDGAVGSGGPLTRDDTLTLFHRILSVDPALPALVAVEYATENSEKS